ncbi:hypothetical protein Bca52824_007783 [Brassica carinata]|uniref:Uncharacterized protein n=1 Tax=Brassica carinata TaxID=52824 RepID=A0A8X7W9M3_BRACI|nr:hypothetical protein Bca52824_007783 [Brassica carinata]
MGNLYSISKTIKHKTLRKRIIISQSYYYLNHLNVTGALKQLSELGAVDIEGKVTDEEFEVSSEGAAALLLRRGESSSSANMSSSSTSKSEDTATFLRKRDGYWAGEEEHLREAEEAKREREWSLKEREGGKMEAERETERGRDLGLKEERETEEAEADMAERG